MIIPEALRAADAHARRTSGPARVVTLLVLVLAGFMMAVSAQASRGNDLRPDRTTELITLVRQEADRADVLADRAAALRVEVDTLARSGSGAGTGPAAPEVAAASVVAQTARMTGPGVTVEMTDAPPSVQPAGVDDDLLVVHQQDIQAVANALWRGGAEAMTIQGQRVSSRTGIKCVGNTVVIHGVPYAPPYRISAIGPVDALRAELEDDRYLKLYRDYVKAYRLGWQVTTERQLDMAPYGGPQDFTHASLAR